MLFKRGSRQPLPAHVAPEFGVQVTLRKGDKIVRRDARGVIHIRRVTEQCVELAHIGSLAARSPRRG
ncbi:MAG TPA: hypothetical protein VFX28_24400 [Methylomirabilota bacterium]|nr:hypothetical protein [Methylomirabilota bacterium]